MYNEQQMAKALREYDWDTAIRLIPTQTVDAVRKLLSDVSRSGCLLRLYKLHVEKDHARTRMIEQLKTFTATFGGPEELQYFDFLLGQIALTECALKLIDEAVEQDEFNSLPPEQQPWASILWASREIVSVHDQIDADLRRSAKDDTVIIDPLTIRTGQEQGRRPAAGRIHQLANTLANTLRMLAHRNGVTSDAFGLRPTVTPDETALSAAARVSRLGDAWECVVDESKYHRFWGGRFRPPVRADESQRAALPTLHYVIASVRDKPDRSAELQVAEYIAANRMQRKALVVRQGLRRDLTKDRDFKNPRASTVALPPRELVSELELVTLYVLDQDMHYDPFKNSMPFGGLTVLEWVRGYSVLEACYVTDSPDGIVTLEISEVEETLCRAGLGRTKARTFIERATFQSGRRDLYDAPLFRLSDQQIVFLAALYRGVNLPMIIASQVGSQHLNVDSKGKTFEKAVLNMLTNAGLETRAFRYSLQGVQYDCDAAAMWDGHLFIFECKNYGLPTIDPADRLYFWQKQIKAIQQVERIAADLRANPAVVLKHFGRAPNWDNIHPVVLNACFLSLPKTPSGTFFYDASALGRFLKEGTLNDIVYECIGGIPQEISVVKKRLWEGNRPSPEDLLREMSEPSQFMMDRKHYYRPRVLIPLAPECAVLVEEPASRPSDAPVL